MKGVHCSWVEFLKLRQSLSGGRRGDQRRLQEIRCVDKSAISQLQAACQIVSAVEGKVELTQLSDFQPTHATALARHFRKQKADLADDGVRNELVNWVERVEQEAWTVQQLKDALWQSSALPNGNEPDDGCTVTDLGELIKAGRKFACVYADPPWQYGNQGTRAATDNHYPTMTPPEIAALPVAELAAERSHLWLWTTNGFLFECPRIFEAWGFTFKSSYIWVKPQMGIGNYLRNAHEFLLLAVRGGLTARERDVMSWGQFDRTGHSAKPDAVRSKVVERVSPGPYLELFGRKDVGPRWTVWGNQIDRVHLFHREESTLGNDTT